MAIHGTAKKKGRGKAVLHCVYEIFLNLVAFLHCLKEDYNNS